jgi:pheromone shutdown protein TraB
MIQIVGTTHLTLKEEIIKIIEEFKPDIIGVELCKTRLNALVLNPVKQEVKEDNSLIGKISSAIKKKAEENKVEYGSDMINASKYALENNIRLELVDKDVNEIRTLMNLIPQNEMMGFMNELAKFENDNLNREVNEKEVLNELKTKYPVSFEFLITSRELFILNNILKLQLNNSNKRILIFLGKGHVNSIMEGLK